MKSAVHFSEEIKARQVSDWGKSMEKLMGNADPAQSSLAPNQMADNFVDTAGRWK